jgi:hypothetical protein
VKNNTLSNIQKTRKKNTPPQKKGPAFHITSMQTQASAALCVHYTPEPPPKNCFCMIFLGCDFVVERILKDPCISKLNSVSLVLVFCFATTPPRERELFLGGEECYH